MSVRISLWPSLLSVALLLGIGLASYAGWHVFTVLLPPDEATAAEYMFVTGLIPTVLLFALLGLFVHHYIRFRHELFRIDSSGVLRVLVDGDERVVQTPRLVFERHVTRSRGRAFWEYRLVLESETDDLSATVARKINYQLELIELRAAVKRWARKYDISVHQRAVDHRTK